ncbi:MAG: hypothetical protein ACM3ML_35530 [Micromonosporaceae bacterium]
MTSNGGPMTSTRSKAPARPRSRRDRGPSRAGRSRHWRLRRLLWLGLVAMVAVAVLNFLTPPWVFHIGDRFTPATMWDGYGTVHASDGGEYVLYAHLQGGLNISRYGPSGCDEVSGCSNLRGRARLCTARGTTYSFTLDGVVSTWWGTDGAPISITLRPIPPRSLPSGFVFVFSGIWRGARLPLVNRDNSFTQVFTPDGAVNWTTPTRNVGHAAATLRAGTSQEFASACHALAAGARARRS